MSESETAVAGTRLDIWLWAVRFYKTRALAKQSIETGKVEVGGERAKPSRSVRIGDTVKIVRGEDIFTVEVTGLGDKRNAASVAQTMYRESEASIAMREAASAQRRAERTGYRAPQTKPDKRARRLIRALGDIDAT